MSQQQAVNNNQLPQVINVGAGLGTIREFVPGDDCMCTRSV